jgi:tRNA dimethylallyltransferase
MDIGTAKPAAAEQAAVPHHLFDVADPRESWGLARFRSAALETLDAIWARGNVPLLVGGTGQYVWGLLEAWSVPEVAPDLALRAELARFAEESGAGSLHARLETIDPVAAARIDPRNVRRVIRAIEVHEHTGRPISALQAKGDPPFGWCALGLDVDRAELDRRTDERVDAMFAQGFVAEVKALLASGIPADAPSMSSIGYAEVTRYVAGALTLPEAIAETKRTSRRLARRQGQWFRRSDERIAWIRDVAEARRVLKARGFVPSSRQDPPADRAI